MRDLTSDELIQVYGGGYSKGGYKRKKGHGSRSRRGHSRSRRYKSGSRCYRRKNGPVVL